MQKTVRQILAVLGRVIFIGLSVQIVLGILWLCLNFANLQEFGESIFYVQISKNFICDEYTGILYPVFLLLARGVEKLIRLPYYCVIYTVQILIAIYSGHAFLQRLKKTGKGMDIWSSLALLTIPMALQCHLAVLPYSLAGSFFLQEISFALDAVRRKEGIHAKQLVKITPFWLLCALLLPEYLYLGAVPVLLVFLCELVRCIPGLRKAMQYTVTHLMLQVIVIAAFGGMIVGMNSLTQVKGYYGKVHNSVEAAFASRFGWSSLMDTYDSRPEELRAAVDRGKLMESAYYAENMARVFGPLIEEAVGEERAKELFMELAKDAWESNRRDILHEMAWDAAGYTLSPIVLQMQLTGRGYDAYSGRNYEIMRHNAPVLSGIYMDYSCWWFAAGLCITAVMQVLYAVCSRKIITWKNILSVMLVLLSCGGLVVWYTMQGAGIMDYKNTIAVNCLWIVWSLLVMQMSVCRREE